MSATCAPPSRQRRPVLHLVAREEGHEACRPRSSFLCGIHHGQHNCKDQADLEYLDYWQGQPLRGGPLT